MEDPLLRTIQLHLDRGLTDAEATRFLRQLDAANVRSVAGSQLRELLLRVMSSESRARYLADDVAAMAPAMCEEPPAPELAQGLSLSPLWARVADGSYVLMHDAIRWGCGWVEAFQELRVPSLEPAVRASGAVVVLRFALLPEQLRFTVRLRSDAGGLIIELPHLEGEWAEWAWVELMRLDDLGWQTADVSAPPWRLQSEPGNAVLRVCCEDQRWQIHL